MKKTVAVLAFCTAAEASSQTRAASAAPAASLVEILVIRPSCGQPRVRLRSA